jgi:hypothetical protein
MAKTTKVSNKAKYINIVMKLEIYEGEGGEALYRLLDELNKFQISVSDYVGIVDSDMTVPEMKMYMVPRM